MTQYNIIKKGEGNIIINIWNTDWHIYKSSKVFLIINIIIVHNMELEYHHHHHHQHEAETSTSIT
jgi:hypothetical protein